MTCTPKVNFSPERRYGPSGTAITAPYAEHNLKKAASGRDVIGSHLHQTAVRLKGFVHMARDEYCDAKLIDNTEVVA